MLNLALGLVHNKANNAANRAQITNLLPLVVPHYLPEGATVDDAAGVSYTLAGVTTEHVARFYQVVPFGVTRPNNMGLLDSHNCIYGNNDTDKTGDHARFFNWLFKRGCDYGADVVCYVRFPNLLSAADVETMLSRLTNTRVFFERTWGKAVSVRLLRALRALGQETMREDLTFDDALPDLRARIQAAGMEYE